LAQTSWQRLVKALKADVKIPEKDILYLQASGNYWELMTVAGRQLLRSTYDEIRKDFPEDRFVRIHRSYIVNISAIEQLQTSKLIITNGQELPISRSYQAAVKAINIL
jgi:DNA-binding LytR/AlgR family response regulator